ncbi:Btz domain-containing protein [Dioscorea alata]|uniref:Btz domain-containing protein n=1 Tax=Dioscorea alata TaxID=55571 RepID=A0ACB7TV99_DIOAL|nr:Btz domain-containing protein [Dioscorea alata]
MHDDRFQENGRGRHRRLYAGRKLWESKDERAWVHDRFEEMNLQDDEEKRMPRGRFRGRGNRRTRGAGRGYVREKKPQAYNDENNQNRAYRTVRGRGPRRYDTLLKSDSANHRIQYKQAAKPQEQTVKTGAGRQMLHSSNAQSEPVIPNKQVFASSLSSASPPFYPSGSSSQDIPIAHKRDGQLGTSSKTLSSPMHLHENFSAPQSGSIPRGKATMESLNHDRLYMDDSNRLVGKPLANSHLSGSSLPLISAAQSSHSVVLGRGLTISAPPNKHPTSSINQAARVVTQTQSSNFLQRPGSMPDQPALRVSTQQLGSRPSSGSQTSSVSQTLPGLSEVGETESPPGASKSKTALVAKGKTGNQGTVLYNGNQVIGGSGAMGLVHGDQGFPGTPALLPVMQFGSQHHGGIPAVGMALPGYVAQPQLGFGNSEMTWVPLLAGASGALGASYGSPYIALDSTYFTRSSGQSSSVTSRESSVNKPADTWKQPEGSETVSDEYGQRQKNKPRRYSEMSFGQ